MGFMFPEKKKNLYYPVNESYFGKTKNLLAAEKAFAKLKNLIGEVKGENDFINKDSYARDWSMTDEARAVSLCFEKEFGFKMSLGIMNSPTANAFTGIPLTGIIENIASPNDMPVLPVKKGQKYYDKSHNYFAYICIISRTIQLCTPAELVALTLHEIGHNFDTSMWRNFSRACYLFTLVDKYHDIPSAAIQLIFDELSNYVALYQVSIHNAIRTLAPELASIIDGISRTCELFLSLFTPFLIFMKRLTPTPIALVSSFGTTGQERFSDSFAVAYGYGKELNTGLEKLMGDANYNEIYRNLIKGDAILEPIYDLNVAAMDLILLLFSDHPSNFSRLTNTRDKLEKDLKDPDTPKPLKKMIKNDLIWVNKEIEQQTSFTISKDPSGKLKFRVFTILLNLLRERTYGVVEFKNFITGLTRSEV